MSLGRPNAVVTIDGRALTAAEAALMRLRIEATPGAHAAAELHVWPRSKFAGTAPGAAMTIALGHAGDEEEVWSGEAAAVDAGPDFVRIEGLAATAALSRARRSQTYVGQTVADIVRDLAGEAPIDTVESDVALAIYSVDRHRSVWSHLRDLARLAGADLTSAPDGGLRFVPARTGIAEVTLRHGAELLAWSLARAAAAEAEAVAAQGAGSEAGAARWHWLRNDPFGAGAGGAVVAALATKGAAEAVGEAAAGRAARAAQRGWLRIVGDPSIGIGDLVETADLPGGDPGVLRVVGVAHALDRAGFVTTLAVEGGGSGGLLGGLGL